MGLATAIELAIEARQLQKAVSQLNPAAKKAIYAAAQGKVIRQGTWDGCAFNAASVQVGDEGVDSIERAAELFSLPRHTVKTFIEVWDSLLGSEEENTVHLISALEDAGLFTEPNSRLPKAIRRTVFKGADTDDMRKFQQELDSGKLDAEVCEASKLLVSA